MALYLKVNVTVMDMSYIELPFQVSFISLPSIIISSESLYMLDSICISGVWFPVPLQVVHLSCSWYSLRRLPHLSSHIQRVKPSKRAMG